jgi:hypothetical protein
MVPEEDARSLTEVWWRLERQLGPRADRMRAQAQAVQCCCVNGPGGWPVEPEDGNCPRCQGGWPDDRPKTSTEETDAPVRSRGGGVDRSATRANPNGRNR